MMKKQAYIILVHKNPNQLNRLLKMLDNENIDIFLHIDKKSEYLFDYELLKKSVVKSELFFVKSRSFGRT